MGDGEGTGVRSAIDTQAIGMLDLARFLDVPGPLAKRHKKWCPVVFLGIGRIACSLSMTYSDATDEESAVS